jgi:hypothetical protein
MATGDRRGQLVSSAVQRHFTQPPSSTPRLTTRDGREPPSGEIDAK